MPEDFNMPRPRSANSHKDDDLVNTILPSYQMYQATISKNLTPSNENFTVDPPLYEVTPVNSSSTLPFVTLSTIQSPVDTPNASYAPSLNEFPFAVETFNQTSAEYWENTILANAHKLPNLTKTNNAINQNLEVKIHVTEEVCQKGVASVPMDPSNREFTQGDYLHGYITIVNKSDKPITFDMVYVVFQGVLVVLDNKRGLIDTEKPSKVFSLLNMMDLFASWSYANIDRLVTDNGDPHDWCEGETDPTDNAVLSIDIKRLFQPNVTYKRFFTFRIPEKLLDDTCEIHNLNKHTEVPPSIGVTRNVSHSMLLANRESQVRDLTFIDTSIAYSIDARVIGRASDYNYPTDRDIYVVAQEATCPIRVIPKQNPESYDGGDNSRASVVFYKAFVDSIKSKIEFGRDLLNAPVNQREEIALIPVSSRDSGSQNKLRQLYDVAGNTINSNLKKKRKQFYDDSYQCLIPFKKKSLTGHSKVLGILSLSTPKLEYRSFYVPPLRYRGPDVNPRKNSQFNIPLELSYFIENGGTKGVLPEIKSISAELVVLSIRSRKYYIPVEINHEMCFRDQEIDWRNREIDNFDTIVIKEFKNYQAEIVHQLQELGNDLIKFESQLFKDVKCLAALQTKYINLSVSDSDTKLMSRSTNGAGLHSSIKTIPWELEQDLNTSGSNSNGHVLYSKKFELQLNLNDFHLKGAENKPSKGFDHLTLVPTFQTCLMARLYYMKVTVKVSTGDSLVVNVPVFIDS